MDTSSMGTGATASRTSGSVLRPRISEHTNSTAGNIQTIATVEANLTGSYAVAGGAVTSGRRRKDPQIEPRFIHQSRALFDACIESIDSAIDSEHEFVLRCNSLDQLRDSLSRLWSLRDKREEQFSEVINMLQGLFFETSVEMFSTAQLACIRAVLCELRDEPESIDDSFANRVTVALLKGGVDVFREME